MLCFLLLLFLFCFFLNFVVPPPRPRKFATPSHFNYQGLRELLTRILRTPNSHASPAGQKKKNHNYPLPERGFAGTMKLTGRNKYFKYSIKSPSWQEADQLAIYKRGRGVEPGATQKQLHLVVRAGLEPGPSGLQVRRPNHLTTLHPSCAARTSYTKIGLQKRISWS